MIILEHIDMEPGRMSLEVRLAGDAPAHTTPQLMQLVLATNPTLAQHSCINSHGPTFGHVMDGTSLPHLLEHLIIDELVHRALAQPADKGADAKDAGQATTSASCAKEHAGTPMRQARAHAQVPEVPEGQPAATPTTQTFVGTTRWLDRQQRTALVQVSFTDDFEALQAVNIALERLNSLIEDYNSLHS